MRGERFEAQSSAFEIRKPTGKGTVHCNPSGERSSQKSALTEIKPLKGRQGSIIKRYHRARDQFAFGDVQMKTQIKAACHNSTDII
jgi:hypothetical protein